MFFPQQAKELSSFSHIVLDLESRMILEKGCGILPKAVKNCWGQAFGRAVPT